MGGNSFFLRGSPSGLAYRSGLMLCGFKADKAHIWWISITELLVFLLVSFEAAACDGAFMSETAYPCIVVTAWGCQYRCPTACFADLMIWASSLSFARQGLTLG